MPLSPFASPNCLPQKVFDLAVDTTQFVLSPGFQLGPELGINAKQKGLAFHEPSRSGVECAGVYHGMDFGFTTEHDHEIASHCGFAFVVKHQHLFIG